MPSSRTKSNAKGEGGATWIAGIGTLSAMVTGEGAPYRPEVLLWLDAKGFMLGAQIDRPGALLARAAHSLFEMSARPALGRAHMPARIRVNHAGLADVLRHAYPALRVEVDAVPEFDEAMASLNATMAQRGEAPSYFVPGVEPRHLALLFRAAAALYREQPWTYVPGDLCLVGISCPSYGLRDAVLTVIGQLGENHGVVLFSSAEDYESFLRAADAVRHGLPVRLPLHWSFNFERAAALPPEQKAEVEQHGLEVAGPAAYPVWFAVEGEPSARALDAQELGMLHAVIAALPRLLRHGDALLDGWFGDADFREAVRVQGFEGDVELTLRTLPVADRYRDESDDALLDAMLDARNADDTLDELLCGVLDAELLRRFADAPEARGCQPVRFLPRMQEIARDGLGIPLAWLPPKALRVLLFEGVPQGEPLSADDVHALFAELRAFYTYMGTISEVVSSPACLRVLTATGEARLAKAWGGSAPRRAPRAKRGPPKAG